MSIRPLPKDVIDKIKSSTVVTSLNDVVCGLLKNSLDANATKVKIHLDYLLGNCTVEDDGHGIASCEFEESGGLGKLHHTSKLPPNPKLHGSHGNFIASVATFSLVTISSCHQPHDAHAALSIHNGTLLTRSIPAAPDQRIVSFRYGTRVSVRNLFGSMPVRVKQRGLIFSDRAKIDREWDSLAREIAALLLSWSSEVSVYLREANTQREARIKTGSSDMISRTSRLFVQAGLAESEEAESWVPVSASSRRVRIKGAISTTPVATRRSQIMCLGIRPIQNSFGTNFLYEEVNKIFKSSSFGVLDDGDIDKIQGKPRKGIERWPMFYLDVHLLGTCEGFAVDDVLGDSQHSLQAIVELLKVVCYGFLKKHWLQPKHVRRAEMKPMPARFKPPLDPDTTQTGLRPSGYLGSNESAARSISYSPLETWHRIKVGERVPTKTLNEHDGAKTTVEEDRPVKTPRRLVGKDGTLVRRPFDDVDDICPTQATTINNESAEETGREVPTVDNKDDSNARPSAPVTTDTPPICQRLEFRPKSQPQKWLQDVLASWKNPIFQPTEPPIPALPQNPVHTDPPVEVRGDGRRSRFFSNDDGVEFEALSVNLSGRLSRQALEKAIVIGQVDRKFILLQLPLQASKGNLFGASSALVMLDQHAADERCRLEELMSLYFLPTGHGLQAASELLETPILFELSAREKALLDRCGEHFQTWGIVLEPRRSGNLDDWECLVSRLPPSILERCRSEPRLVIELVRQELWKVDDRGVPPRPLHEAGRSWTSCFHNCPRGILELLHSRSCRSAIMFNDELSPEECERLVQRLSRCAFPFQCAHGRPSLAPLVDIGGGSGRLGSWGEMNSRPGVGYWKKWLHG